MNKTRSLTRQQIDEAKSRFALSEIVSKRGGVKLRRAGNEMVGLCPFHDENTPSFRVNDDKGLFNCFGCGAGGDVIQFLERLEGKPFGEIARSLLDITDIPERKQQDRAAVDKRERADRAAAILAAQLEWHEARNVRGTPAEIYLRGRGIIGDMPATVKFGRVPVWRNKETGAEGRRIPALLLAAQDRSGAIVGVQHVFLTEDGKKAPISKPKMSLGQVRGCAVRLAPAARRIILIEGPEDGLTIRQRASRVPVWITLGTGMMPFVELPDIVRHVTLAGDNNAAGRAAVQRAIPIYEAQGRTVDTIFPPPAFEDFNDELRGIEIAA